MDANAIVVAIVGGGLFTFLASVVGGMFLWAKNHADAASTVAEGAKVLLGQLMEQREQDKRVILRQQKVIVGLVEDNVAVKEWMEKVTAILDEHGISDIPEPPRLTTSLNSLVEVLIDDVGGD